MSNKKVIIQMVVREAQRQGVDPRLALSFVDVESSFDPNDNTGSYKGLFQLSHNEFGRYGGKGSIFNPQANIRAGIKKMKSDTAWFEQKTGRKPTLKDLYFVHQRGRGGVINHANLDPNAPAWHAMYNTAEGRRRGKEWAQRTVWENVDSRLWAKYGGKHNLGRVMTNGDFNKFWDNRLVGKWQKYGGTPEDWGGKSLAPTVEDISIPGTQSKIAPGDMIQMPDGGYVSAETAGVASTEPQQYLPQMSPRASEKAVEKGVIDHYMGVDPNNPLDVKFNPKAEHRGPTMAPLPVRGDRLATDQGQAGDESLPPPVAGSDLDNARAEEMGMIQDEMKYLPLAQATVAGPMREVNQPELYEKNYAVPTTAEALGGGMDYGDGPLYPYESADLGPTKYPKGMIGGGHSLGSMPKAPGVSSMNLDKAPVRQRAGGFDLNKLKQFVATARKFGV